MAKSCFIISAIGEGIGTTNPAQKLEVNGHAQIEAISLLCLQIKNSRFLLLRVSQSVLEQDVKKLG